LMAGIIKLITGSIKLITGSIKLITGSIKLITGSIKAESRQQIKSPSGYIQPLAFEKSIISFDRKK